MPPITRSIIAMRCGSGDDGVQSRPIRLTYVITDLEVGGVPLHLHRLATRLPRDRFSVRVISLADEGPVGRRLAEAGVPVFACRARSAMDLAAPAVLYRLLRKDPPDVLHALLFHANVAARLVGPLAGVPVARILCEIQTAECERTWHLIADNLTCRLCRLEVGNSPSVVEHLRRHAHIPRTRLRCMWGAVDADAFAGAEPISRAELGLPQDEPVVLWTGRLDPVKGFEEMLSAFAQVVRVRPANLLLAGEGAYRARIEELIGERGLTNRVHLLGVRHDVARLLHAANAFLFGSRTEGLPNAVLEAMAAGLPIVATAAPGCRDLLRHGVTGLLSPVGDVERLAHNLRAVLDDRRLADALGRSACRWVRDHADLAACVAHWTDLYASIAG